MASKDYGHHNLLSSAPTRPLAEDFVNTEEGMELLVGIRCACKRYTLTDRTNYIEHRTGTKHSRALDELNYLFRVQKVCLVMNDGWSSANIWRGLVSGWNIKWNIMLI